MPEIGGGIGIGERLALLLTPGQLTQYGGYDDAGKLRRGLSKLYTILTTGQYAGTTSITLYNKTDLISNNCVYDRRTKLTWSRYLSDGLGPTSIGKLPWTTNANGEGIYAFAAAANAAKLGGYSDWRIPNDTELLTLRDMEAPTAAPNATAFPSWPNDYVWSSTTAPSNTANAMLVLFSTGGLSSTGVKTTAYFVSLVRGG